MIGPQFKDNYFHDASLYLVLSKIAVRSTIGWEADHRTIISGKTVPMLLSNIPKTLILQADSDNL